MRGEDIYLGFGKHAGTRLKDAEAGFLRWILRGDFTPSVKLEVMKELKRRGFANI